MFVVTNSRGNISGDEFSILDVKYFADLNELPSINKGETLLFNFSIVESFSLVIGEWLATGCSAFSTANAEVNEYWIKYKGFFEFHETGNIGIETTLQRRNNGTDCRKLQGFCA